MNNQSRLASRDEYKANKHLERATELLQFGMFDNTMLKKRWATEFKRHAEERKALGIKLENHTEKAELLFKTAGEVFTRDMLGLNNSRKYCLNEDALHEEVLRGKGFYESIRDKNWVTKIEFEKNILKEFLEKEKGNSNRHPDYWLKLKVFLEVLETHQNAARRQQERAIKEESARRQQESERKVQRQQRLAESKKDFQ